MVRITKPKKSRVLATAITMMQLASTHLQGAAGIICTGIILVFSLACCAVVAGEEAVFDVVGYGAIGDGSTDDTKAFEAAWAAACGADAPSSSMVVPAWKTFLVGPVEFQGPCAPRNITVQVMGTIVAPPASAWSVGRKFDYWLMFYRVDGLTVTGNGMLDGNGQSWWGIRCSDLDCVESAPTALKLVQCNSLVLSHFSSRNSPQMHIAIIEQIRHRGASHHHRSGEQPEHGRHPRRELQRRADHRFKHRHRRRLRLHRLRQPLRHGPRHHLRPRSRNKICAFASLTSIGSLGKDGAEAAVEYIEVSNVQFINTKYGARIKTWEGGEGYAKSISFTDIEFTNVENPVLITQFYRGLDGVGAQEGAVAVSNVTYTNLRGTSSQATAVAFECSTAGSCTDIHVNTMRITGPTSAQETVARCQNVQGDTSGNVYPVIPCLQYQSNFERMVKFRMFRDNNTRFVAWSRSEGAAAGIICASILLVALACGTVVAADEDRVFNVVRYGARGNGRTDDTKVRVRHGFYVFVSSNVRRASSRFGVPGISAKAFAGAWAAACVAGAPSASIHVPARKTFLVGPVAFQGPCASPRITVKVMGNITAPPACSWSGGTKVDYWLMFYQVDGLTVTGKGMLDGNGESWWVRRCSDLGCVKAAPTALKLVNCNNLELSHFRSENSPQMHIVVIASRSVRVKHLTIVAPGDSPNTDGIHIGQSENVRITDSTIATGDDCVSIGSGSRFVTVHDVTCGPGHGVSVGSLGKHGGKAAVEHVDVRNVHFINTMNGARIKTWEGGQGYAKSISFTNIEFTNVDNPVVINQFYEDRGFPVKGAVAISNITYTNLRGTSSQSTAVAFECSRSGSCTEIHVRSMKITGPGGRKAVARCLNAQGDTTGYIYPKISCLK
ncbi:hypothetical protein EJB05_38376, partial [Eragrostis curvula]